MSFKKILALVMVFAMCLSLFPASAFADTGDDAAEPAGEEVVVTDQTDAETVEDDSTDGEEASPSKSVEVADEEDEAEEEEEVVVEEEVEESETVTDAALDAGIVARVKNAAGTDAKPFGSLAAAINAAGTVDDLYGQLSSNVVLEAEDTETETITIAKDVSISGAYAVNAPISVTSGTVQFSNVILKKSLSISGGTVTLTGVTASSVNPAAVDVSGGMLSIPANDASVFGVVVGSVAGDIKGGKFVSVDNILLADGYVTDDYSSTATYCTGTVYSANAVAMIGSGAAREYYTTFDAAVTAAANTKTIVLLANIGEYAMTANQTIIVNKNGKTLTVYAKDAAFVVKVTEAGGITTYTKDPTAVAKAKIGKVTYGSFSDAAAAAIEAVITDEGTTELVEILAALETTDVYTLEAAKKTLQVRLNGKVAEGQTIVKPGAGYTLVEEFNASTGVTSYSLKAANVEIWAKDATSGQYAPVGYYDTFAEAVAAYTEPSGHYIKIVNGAYTYELSAGQKLYIVVGDGASFTATAPLGYEVKERVISGGQGTTEYTIALIDYTITYAEGTAWAQGVIAPDTYTIASVGVEIPNPVKQYYNFKDWTIAPARDGEAYSFGVTYGENAATIMSESYGDVVLTPNFDPYTYKVHFEANGAEGSMADQDFTFGVSQPLTALGFTYAGKTFAGWSLNEDGSGTLYADGYAYPAGDGWTGVDGGTKTLYAVWVDDSWAPVSAHVPAGDFLSADQVYDAETKTLTISNAKIKISAEGSEAEPWTAGRPAGYAWVGVKFTTALSYPLNPDATVSFNGGDPALIRDEITNEGLFEWIGVSTASIFNKVTGEGDNTYTWTFSFQKDANSEAEVITVIFDVNDVEILNVDPEVTLPALQVVDGEVVSYENEYPVTFMSKGEVYKETSIRWSWTVDAFADPVWTNADSEYFDGWYLDEEYTQPFGFYRSENPTQIFEATTVYAKYTKCEASLTDGTGTKTYYKTLADAKEAYENEPTHYRGIQLEVEGVEYTLAHEDELVILEPGRWAPKGNMDDPPSPTESTPPYYVVASEPDTYGAVTFTTEDCIAAVYTITNTVTQEADFSYKVTPGVPVFVENCETFEDAADQALNKTGNLIIDLPGEYTDTFVVMLKNNEVPYEKVGAGDAITVNRGVNNYTTKITQHDGVRYDTPDYTYVEYAKTIIGVQTWNVKFVNGTEIVEEKTVDDQTKVDEAEAPTPETGLHFVGWALDGEVVPAEDWPYTITGNTIFTATYAGDSFTIKFAGGSGASGTTDSITATFNDASVLPENGFTKTGYTFNGYKAGSGTTAVVVAADATELTVEQVNALFGLATVVEEQKEVTLTAQWTVNSYKVAFDKNPPAGHTAEDVSGTMADESFNYGTAKNLTANDYALAGYTFKGWALTADGDVTYTDGQSVKNLSATAGDTVTLYAVWEQNAFLIRFAKNSGSGTMLDQEVFYDSTTNLKKNSYTRTGYDFDGWKLGETAYTDEQSLTVEQVNALYNAAQVVDGEELPVVTLTAQWRVHSYSVKFDANNAKATGSMDDQGFTYGAYQTLTKNAFAVYGYNFKGWALTPDATTVKYTDEQRVRNLTAVEDGVVTLYAVWAPDTFTIEFAVDEEIATYVTGSTASIEGVTYDSDFADASATPDPVIRTLTENGFVYDGFTFKDWFDGENFYADKAELVKDTVNQLYDHAVDGVVTLKAEWTMNQYSIAFNANGGEGEMATIGPIDYVAEQKLPANTFERYGYTFTGWNTKADASGTPIADEATVSKLRKTDGATVTLYAQWKANEFTIAFAGGEGATGSMEPMAVTYAAKANPEKLTANSFAKTGYTFDKWALVIVNEGAEGEDPVENTIYFDDQATLTDEALQSLYPGKGGTVTLVAQWVGDTFEVKLEKPQGQGQSISGDPTKVTLQCGVAYDFPTPFTKTGYSITAWNVMGEHEAVVETIGTSLTAEQVDELYTHGKLEEVPGGGPAAPGVEKPKVWTVKLRAVFTANNYTVVFNANNEAAIGEMEDESFTYDAAAQALTENAFEVHGYHFIGWATSAESTTVAYTDKQTVQNLTADPDGVVNLYALWAADEFAIAFDGSGGSAAQGVQTAQTVTYDSGATLIANPYTLAGNKFVQWTVDSTNFEDEAVLEAADVNALYELAIYDETVQKKVVTLYAEWSAETYTVTFDPANGEQAFTQSVTWPNPVVKPETDPEKFGYTFSEWKRGESSWNWNWTVTQNITLTAAYTPNQFTVVFDGNGETSGSMSDVVTYTYDAAATSGLPGNAFVRAGYTFTSWNTAADGSGIKLINWDSPDATVVNSLYPGKDGQVTLYAQWKADPASITFKAIEDPIDPADPVEFYVLNGVTDQAVTDEDLALIALAIADVTPEGFEFDSFDKEIPATLFGDEVIIVNWKPLTFTVTFDSNGGSEVPAKTDVPYHTTIDLPTPTNEDPSLKFDGWYSDPTFTSASKWTKNTLVLGDVTLYAKWSTKTFTVKFDMNGADSEAIAKQTIKYGELVTKPEDPTLAGNVFAGWTLNDEAYDFETPVTSSFTLTATWTQMVAEFDGVLYDSFAEPAALAVDSEEPVILWQVPAEDDVFYMQTGVLLVQRGDGVTEFTIGQIKDQIVKPYDANYKLVAEPVTGAYKFTVTRYAASLTNGLGETEYYDTFGEALAEYYLHRSYYKYIDLVDDCAYTMAADDEYFVVKLNGHSIEVKPVDNTFTVTRVDSETADTSTFSVTTNIAKVDYQKMVKVATVEQGVYVFEPDGPVETEYFTTLGAAVDFKNSLGTDPEADPHYDATITMMAAGGVYDLPAGDTLEIVVPAEDLKPTIGSADRGYKAYMLGKDPTTGVYSWKSFKLYEVTYVAADGEEFVNPEENPTLFTTADYQITLLDASRTGYTFVGWTWPGQDEPVKKPRNDDLKINVSEMTADLEITAHFSINSYKVTFMSDGAKYDEQMVVFNTVAVEPDAPTKIGYTYGGWFTDAACTEGKEFDFSTPITKATTLYAKWTANTFTVKYNANGGEGEMEDSTFIYDDDTNTHLTPVTFEKFGYTFKNWNTVAEPTEENPGVSYNNGGYVKNIAESGTVELYAQWEPNAFKIAFAPNGGSGNMDDMEVTYKAAVPAEQLTENAFTRRGYTFQNWTVTIPGEEPVTLTFENKATLTDEALQSLYPGKDETVTLTAQWTANGYTVVFDKNDARAEGTMADQAFTYGVSQALSENEFTLYGYTFAGWSLTADGAVKYRDKQSVKNLTSEIGGTVTLYAVWTANTFTVEFNKGMGTSGDMNSIVLTYDADQYVDPAAEEPVIATLPANAFKYTGYTFSEWLDVEGETYANKASLDKDTVNKLYAAAKFEVIDDVTTDNLVTVLEAQWTMNTYNIAFDANAPEGKTVEGSMADIENIPYVDEQVLPANAFSLTGYTFTGWNTKADGTGKTYADGATVSKLSSRNGATVTLYAQWEANTFTIAFEGGEGTTGTTNSVTATYDATVTLTSNGFKKTGYSFANWVDTAENTYKNKAKLTVDQVDALYAIAEPVVLEDGTVLVATLTAQWTANSYTVSYDANTGRGTAPESQTYVYDGDPVIVAENTFTKTGYHFVGWNYIASPTEELPGVVYQPGDLIEGIIADMVLYAQWEPDAFTIAFEGGEGATGTMEPMEVTYKQTSPVSSLTPNAFEKTGYTFKEWALIDNSGEEPVVVATFADHATLTNSALAKLYPGKDGTVTLTAQWTANTFEVKFNGNGAYNDMAMTNQVFTYDEAQTLKANEFEHEHCKFVGWNTKADGTGNPYTDKEELTAEQVNALYALAVEGVVDFYAQWASEVSVVDGTMTPKYYGTFAEAYADNETALKDGTARIRLEMDDVKAVLPYEGAFTLIPNGKTGFECTAADMTPPYYIVVDGNNYSTALCVAKVVTVPYKSTYVDFKEVWVPDWENKTEVNKDTFADAAAFALDKSDLKDPDHDKKFIVLLTENTVPYTLAEGTELLICVNGQSGANLKSYADDQRIVVNVFDELSTDANNPVRLYAYEQLYFVKFFVEGEEVEALREAKLTGEKADKPEYLPVKTGYTFQFWTKDGEAEYDWTAAIVADVDLVALFTPNTYYVDFYRNGPQCPIVDPQLMTYDQEEALKANEFVYDGYSFAGWNTKADGSGTPYADEEVVKNLSATQGEYVKLYAQWTANTYTLTFDANGGEAVEPTTYTIEGKAVVPTATRVGYTLDGWLVDQETAEPNWTLVTDIVAPGEYSSMFGNATLVAQWTAEKFKVGFNANSDDATGTMTKKYAYYDAEFAIPANNFELVDYDFAGWALTPDGEVVFDDAATLTAEDVDGLYALYEGAEVTFYAKWTAHNYSITYQGELPEGYVESAPATYNVDEMVEGVVIVDPELIGKEFQGWTVEVAGHTVPGIKGEDAIIVTGNFTGDRVYTAVWTDILYELTFDADGGRVVDPDGNKVSSYTLDDMKYGDTVVYPTADPTKTGYEFIGWDKELETMPAEDVTITAQWQVKQYTLTFYATEGDAEPYAVITQDYKSDVTKPNDPTKTGFTFDFWTLDGETETAVPNKMPAKDMTFYGHWTGLPATIVFLNGTSILKTVNTFNGEDLTPNIPTYSSILKKVVIPEGKTLDPDDLWEPEIQTPVLGNVNYQLKWKDLYTVSFEANGVTVKTITNIMSGKTIAETEVPDVKKDGKAPNGWLINGESGNFFFFDETPVNSNMNLVATWDETPTVTVTFETEHGVAPEGQVIEKGGYAVKPADPTEDGWTFVEWQLDGEAFSFDTPIESSITLVAVWEKLPGNFKYSRSLTLKDNINVNYYFSELAEGTEAADYDIIVTFDGETKTYNLATDAELVDVGYGPEYKLVVAITFSFQMVKPIVCQFQCKGVDIGSDNYSVQQYFLNRLEKSKDAKFKAVCLAALDYGANAQLYFNVDADNLANAPTNPDNVINATRPTNEKATSGSVPAVKTNSIGRSLIFGSETSIKVYFKLNDGYTLDGLTFTCEGFEVTEPVASGNEYFVKILGIKSFELSREFNLVISDGTNALTITYSPYAYANSKWESTTPFLAKLVQALVAYGDAAKAMWG